VLEIAPSGYKFHASRKRTPELLCARANRDETLMPQIQAVWQANMPVYGADKGWQYVAFVIDVFARRIVGWRVSSSMRMDFVLDAPESQGGTGTGDP
jgi:transposase InsO family protein